MDEPRKKNVCIRLTDAEYEAVSRYAAEHNWTVTKVLVEGFGALQGRDLMLEIDDTQKESQSEENPDSGTLEGIEATAL